ncbi:MAG: LamG domain-containing protein, partial [Planctomycetota bacterium]|nr:LamG domain-containing protein [Planctomycetota bacterium]
AGADPEILSWGSEGGGLKVEFRLHDGRLRIEHGNGNNRSETIVNDGQWHHVVAVLPEGGLMEDVQFYVDGEPGGTFQVGNGTNPFITIVGIDLNIGRSGPRADRHFTGLIDEVRMYSRELTQDEIRQTMEISAAGSNPLASGPKPADGSRHESTWANLNWTPGAFAVSHDVYAGDNFVDVNDGSADTFRGNQAGTLLVVGFPGFPFPDGLVPGTTYYWRIDQVNEADPNSPWKGDVWSFTVPPRKAYEPIPSDGAKFADPGTTLSWKVGMNGKLHSVYFGDNPDEVGNAAGALPLINTTYDPGALESGKTYYWRVDEFDGATTHTGDLWSFTTIPDIPIGDPNLLALYKLDEAKGSTAVDSSGHASHGTLMGTAQWVVPGLVGDAALNFGQNGYVAIRNLTYEGDAYAESTVCVWMRTENQGTQIVASFGPANYWRLAIDSYGAGFGLIDWDVMTSSGQAEHGSLTRVDDGFWHHVCCVFDKGFMAIYIDGRLDATMTGGPTFGSGATRYGFLGADSLADTFDGARDRRASLMGDIDDFRIYDRALTQEEITLIMRGDPLLAWNPSPSNGSNPGLRDAASLTWSAGDNAAQHDVYFGTDIQAVKDADASDTTGIYRGRQNATTFTPPEGVEWGGGPYYWRIDEYGTDGTISRGGTWTFTVADFIGIDGFESYNDIAEAEPGSNRIYMSWIDGFGTTTNGAFVGNMDVPLTERSNVHGGAQAMPLSYDNNLKTSEATMTLVYPRDWTEQGVTKLSLWFRGEATNTPERMFVALNGSAVVYHDDPAVTQIAQWTEWAIDLQAFAGVDLTNVNTITIGFGTKSSLAAGGAGQMYFDDIRLYRPTETAGE